MKVVLCILAVVITPSFLTLSFAMPDANMEGEAAPKYYDSKDLWYYEIEYLVTKII